MLGAKGAMEVMQLEVALQTALSNLYSRRKTLNEKEAGELGALDGSAGRRISTLDAQISNSSQAEANEMASRLKKLQDDHVSNWLSRFSLQSALIPGVGPGFKARLMRAGIFTAADVDHRIFGVPLIGPTRQAALTAWKGQLAAAAQRTIPTRLQPSEVAAISSKYSLQRSDLKLQRAAAHQQYTAAQAEIKARYALQRDAIGQEQAQTFSASQANIAAVRSSYSERCGFIERSQAELADGLKKTILEKDRSASEAQKQVLALRWQREKLRREVARFRNLTFGNYIKRLVFMA
jgi:hypothetical protein